PGRVAMHQQDGRGIARAFVHVMDTQRGSVLVRHGRVVRGEIVTLKVREALVGCAKNLHSRQPLVMASSSDCSRPSTPSCSTVSMLSWPFKPASRCTEIYRHSGEVDMSNSALRFG